MVKQGKSKQREHGSPHSPSTFTRPGERDRHVRAVHGKRRDHACPHCAAAFGHASHLATHVRTQHTDNTPDNECESSAAAAGVNAV
jgi:hypothetical protein